jgi:hypothetical protein
MNPQCKLYANEIFLNETECPGLPTHNIRQLLS